MNRNEKWILLTYIWVQLMTALGGPVALFITTLPGGNKDLQTGIYSFWITLWFFIGSLSTLILLKGAYRSEGKRAMAPLPSLFWSILGVGFVFLAQEIAIFLESLMGIRPGSENTQMILSLIEQSPWMILTGTVFAPILEEIVFRKILFTAFLKRMNVMNAALASSLIFAAAHFEFEHLLLYTSVGLVFAALYQKTGRIMSPIFCHIFMNAIVILARYA